MTSGGLSPDSLQIASVRGEMMKIQQSIQRLTSQFEGVIDYIPALLPQTVSNLQQKTQNIQKRVQEEVSYDYKRAFRGLKDAIRTLDKDFTSHVLETRMSLTQDPFTQAVFHLESELNQINNRKMRALESLVDTRLLKY
jgi:ElaB/YqjD/DUF883 family membrane-anchored ribosome-binding protein